MVLLRKFKPEIFMTSKKDQEVVGTEDATIRKARHDTRTAHNMMSRRAFYAANPAYSPAEEIANFVARRAKS